MLRGKVEPKFDEEPDRSKGTDNGSVHDHDESDDDGNQKDDFRDEGESKDGHNPINEYNLKSIM